MNDEFLGERRRALEESYFAKYNRELIERLRAAKEAPAGARAFAMDDDVALVQAARGAGTESPLLVALSLAPLVAIAWAEDGIDDSERSIILARAKEMGLGEADPGYRLLERWLAERPAELLDIWRREYVSALSSTLSHEAKRELKAEVLARARAVIQATGGFSGVGRMLSAAEQAVLQEIEEALS